MGEVAAAEAAERRRALRWGSDPWGLPGADPGEDLAVRTDHQSLIMLFCFPGFLHCQRPRPAGTLPPCEGDG